jgi:hypothetical protein
MNRLQTVIATTGAICVASQALATDSVDQATMSKREMIVQIADCMKRRMAANKDSSYREALKACKKQVVNGSDDLTSDTVVTSGTQAKP